MNLTNIFLGEWLGTMALIIIGNGGVANVIFRGTKGSKGGIIAIAFGWAIAVFAGAAIANIWNTGGHINPAVTLGFLVGGASPADAAFVAIAAQMLGALMGQMVLNGVYYFHIKEETPTTVLGMHATTPTHNKINAIPANVFSELVATGILVVSVYFAISQNWFNGAPLAVALIVLGIGLTLGGTTGYAINPARDLAPRIIHTAMYVLMRKRLPFEGNWRTLSAWNYAWIPVAAPLAAGAVVGAFLRVQ